MALHWGWGWVTEGWVLFWGPWGMALCLGGGVAGRTQISLGGSGAVSSVCGVGA